LTNVLLDEDILEFGDCKCDIPHRVVRMDDGELYVSDNRTHSVWPVTSASKPLDSPVGLFRMGEQLLVANLHMKTLFTLDVTPRTARVLPVPSTEN